MSVWLTPDGKPVVGGTYFPPDDRHGRSGFTKVCHEVGRLWRDDRAKMEVSAARLMKQLQQQAAGEATVRGLPGPKVFGDFLDRCEAMFDPDWGGFGGAPKFPRPVIVRTLMQLSERFGKDSDEGEMAWQMCERTLRGMAAGGMHDHLGGGFHRYSVDRFWHVPHYEKMLYDQAQLAQAYLDGWQISAEPLFREVAEGIFRYLLETLRDGGARSTPRRMRTACRLLTLRKSARARSGHGKPGKFPRCSTRATRRFFPRRMAWRHREMPARKAIRTASWKTRTRCSARCGTMRWRRCSIAGRRKSASAWPLAERCCWRRGRSVRRRTGTTRS